MNKRSVISALLALSLAACSVPQVLQPTDSSVASSAADLISGNPNGAEEVNTVDSTPAQTDQHLQATAVAWTGTKFAFNDPNDVENGKGVSVDSGGNVIVVASRIGDLILNDTRTTHPTNTGLVKLNPSGVRLWTRTLGSSNQANIPAESAERATVPAGVVIDPSGNIYVAGGAATALNGKSNAGGQDAYLVKYNPSGNLVWTRMIGSVGNDGVTGIAINGTNIYLTGYACGNGFNFAGSIIRGTCDVFVSKYDSGGNRLWAKLFGSNLNDLSAKIAKVSSGGAVVVGTNQGALDANGNPQNKNGFVVRLDPNGNMIWTRTIATPQNDDALAVSASSDAVYVGGQTQGNLNGAVRSRTGANSSDAFLVKLSLSAGATQWTRYVASSEFDAVSARANVTDLALNSSGQLFVFGDGFNSASEDTDVPWPVRYDAAGNRTADAVKFGYATPDGTASNAKVAMGIAADGVFVVLDDYLNKTPAIRRGNNFEVFVTKLGFDLKQK
jgi:hypothetical protein